MFRLGAEEPYMNQERRDSVLSQINTGRSQQARIQSLLASLPAWTDRPFKGDQENFDHSMKVFQDTDPLVTKVETRLRNDPGPVWRDFTNEELTAFTNWVNALANMDGYVSAYFPTDEQQRYMTYVCIGVAVVSFVLPLLISDGDSDLKFPIDPKPVPLPPGMRPRLAPAPSGAVVSTLPQRPTFRAPSVPIREAGAPTFSRIPAATKAIPVQAEVLRPATAAAPWRQTIQSPPPSSVPTPGFRSFVKPLGPSEPVTARTAQAVASGAPVSPGAAAHTPHIYPKPQFRRQ